MLSLHLLYHFLGKATDLTFREGDGNNLPKLSPKCTALISISSIYFKGCPKVFRDSTAHVSSEEFVVLERTHSLCQNSHSVETSCQGVKTQSSIKAKSRGTSCCVCTRFLDLQEKAAFFPFWPVWGNGEKVRKWKSDARKEGESLNLRIILYGENLVIDGDFFVQKILDYMSSPLPPPTTTEGKLISPCSFVAWKSNPSCRKSGTGGDCFPHLIRWEWMETEPNGTAQWNGCLAALRSRFSSESKSYDSSLLRSITPWQETWILAEKQQRTSKLSNWHRMFLLK